VTVLSPRTLIENVQTGAFEKVEGVAVAGEVSFSGAAIAHPVLLTNVTFQGPVDFSDACVQGSLEFFGCVFERGLRATNCRIAGDLTFDRVRVEDLLYTDINWDPPGPVIDARGAHVEGSLVATDLRAAGAICLDDATIRGALLIQQKPALNGPLRTSAGNFSMVRARCGADVDVTGLTLEVLSTSRSLHPDAARCFDGAGATVGGQFRFHPHVPAETDSTRQTRKDEERENPGAGDSNEVDPQNDHGSWADIPGHLDLRGARIEHLVVSAHSFQNAEARVEDEGLNLEGATIRELEIVSVDSMPRKKEQKSDGSAVARIRALVFKKPGFPVPLHLGACEVTNWNIGADDRSPGRRFEAFLECDEPYTRGTYLTVERSLRDRGFTADADRVYRAMSTRERRERWERAAEAPLGWRIGKFLLLGLTTFWWGPFRMLLGYGTAPWRLFVFFIAPLYLAASLSAYRVTANLEPTLQARNVMAAGRIEAREHPDPSRWGVGDALMFGLRFHVPFPGLEGRSQWQLSSTGPVRLDLGAAGRAVGVSSPVTWCLDPESFGMAMLLLNLAAWPPFIGFVVKRLFRQ
jgi:pentapeptide repeat protein